MDILNEMIRIFLVSLATYVSVVIMMRISGKRTLSKLNSFDFIATVGLGSILASTATNSIELHKGLVAFASIVFFQFVVSKLTTKYTVVQKAVLFRPTLLFYEGKFIDEALDNERMSKQEIHETIRQNGTDAIENVKAVVLEGEGSLSVIPYADQDGDYQSILDHTDINKPKDF